MSVVVSSAGVGVGGGGRMAGTGGGTPCKTNITAHTPQQEGEEEEESGGGRGGGGDDIDGWRQAVRAKVTTLKCHVMASCGLTSDGHIVAPYSPRLLLDSPNSRLLLDATSLDLDAYVEALHRADGLLAKNGGTGGGGDGGTNSDGNSASASGGGGGGDDVSLGDVQLRLQQEGLTNGHTSPSPTSPAKSTPNGSTTPKSPPPSPAPSPIPSSSTPTFAKVVEVNGHTLNGHHPHHHSSRDAVNGSPSPPPSGEEDGVDGERVRQELAKAKRQLKEKEAEVLRLGRIRDEVENELQELTANLFQVSVAQRC